MVCPTCSSGMPRNTSMSNLFEAFYSPPCDRSRCSRQQASGRFSYSSSDFALQGPADLKNSILVHVQFAKTDVNL